MPRYRRAANRLAAGQGLRVIALCEFRQHLQGCEPLPANPGASQKVVRFSVQQGAQAAEARHKSRRSAAIEHRSQQLDVARVRERFLVHVRFCGA